MLIRSRIFPPECLVSQRFQMKSRVWCRQKQRPSAVWIVIFRTLRSLKSRLPNVRPQAERSVCNLKETKGKELSLTNKESFHINLTIIANYHDQWGPLTIMGLGAHETAARGRSDMLYDWLDTVRITHIRSLPWGCVQKCKWPCEIGIIGHSLGHILELTERM